MAQNAIEKRSFFEQALASNKVRPYVPPPSEPASVESLNDLIQETIIVSRFIREAQSQFGRSSLLEIIRRNADRPDTVWVNHTTVLYQQVKEALAHGPFLASVVQYASNQNPGQYYYALEAPEVEPGSGRASAATVSVSGRHDADEELPF